VNKTKRNANPSFTEAAKRPDYEQAVAELEKLCGKKRRPLPEAKGGFALHLDPAKARAFKLEKVHTDFLKRGFYVFDTDPGREKCRIAILPTTDKYDAVLAMGTNGVNWGREPRDIVTWLRRLEKDQPFVLTGVSCEHVSGRFTTRVKSPEELAIRIFEFSPDLGDPVDTEKELRKSGQFWLWWT